jgi:hypothetical protein
MLPSYDQVFHHLSGTVIFYQVFIFHRLKTNHDTHEFILDSGTIADKNSTVICQSFRLVSHYHNCIE